MPYTSDEQITQNNKKKWSKKNTLDVKYILEKYCKKNINNVLLFM